jgi:hypothetical protein
MKKNKRNNKSHLMAAADRKGGKVASRETPDHFKNMQGNWLLKDIYGGVCGHRASPRTLAGNAFHEGFYWPTAVADAEWIVRTCEGFQYYAWQTHLLAQAL